MHQNKNPDDQFSILDGIENEKYCLNILHKNNLLKLVDKNQQKTS